MTTQDYTVATTAQLLGRKRLIQRRTDAVNPGKTKTALKTNYSHTHQGSVLKSVRFISAQDPERSTSAEAASLAVSDPAPGQNRRLNELLDFQNAISFEALQGTSAQDIEVLVPLKNSQTKENGNQNTETGWKEFQQNGGARNPDIDLESPCLPLDLSAPNTMCHVQDTNIKFSEIYFTPAEVDRTSTWLSSPRTNLDKKLRKYYSQASHETIGETLPNYIFISNPNEDFQITLAQLDQLVFALAKSPLVQSHIDNYWWDEAPAIISEVSTSSFVSASTLYSQPNAQFVNSKTPRKQKPRSERPFSTKSPELSVPSTSQNRTSLAIIDPEVHGSPIHLFSYSFRPASIGHCTFINIPYGSNLESAFRISPHISRSSHEQHAARIKVTLQITLRLLDRETGRRRKLLVTNLDISPELRTAAVEELGALIGKQPSEITTTSHPAIFSHPLSNFCLSSSSHFAQKPSNTTTTTTTTNIPQASVASLEKIDEQKDIDQDDDWIALADTLQRNSDIADAVDQAAEQFTLLSSSAETSRPTKAMCALLKLIDCLRDEYARCWVLRPGAEAHLSGIPKSMGVPWVSSTLYAEMMGKEEDERRRERDKIAGSRKRKGGKDEENMPVLLTELIERIAKTGHGRREFEECISGQRVRCVPVTDGGGAGGGVVVAWVCFLRGPILEEG